MTEQPTVLCLDCRTPVKALRSRARRIGERCWRERRRKARAQAAPVALPGMSGRGGPGQSGPDLLTGVDLLADADEDGQR